MLSNITNFPNGITSFGIPVFGSGEVPLMFGRGRMNRYFVDGATGSDSNSGDTPDNAYATIGKAITVSRAKVDWTLTPWANRDIIIIAPGVYTENHTTLAHGAIFLGLGWDNRDAQMGVKIMPASGYPINVGGIVNSAFINIGFESADASPACKMAIANNCLFLGCRFSGAAETVTCVQAFLTNDATCSKWINCDFTCAARGFYAQYVDAGDGFNHCLIEHCRITQFTTAGIAMSTNLVGPSSIVTMCDIMEAGQTGVKGILDDSGILCESRNMIEVNGTAVSGVRCSNGSYGKGVLLT